MENAMSNPTKEEETMNDRFKFRVWDFLGESYEYWTLPGPEQFPAHPASCDWVAEQCTGLKDKNGNLIYEGDIVKSSTGVMGTIIWRQGKLQLRGRFRGKRFSYDMTDNRGPLMEVIGNIHENPELLDQGDE
jgi:hypothetical protein